MKINQILLFLFASAAFFECKQNAGEGAKNAAAAPVFEKGKANALALHGTIGAENATLHLVQTPNPSGGGGDFYFGSYFLDSEERPIELSGAIDSAGNLRLEIFDRAAEGAYFYGKMASDFSGFEGAFSAGKDQKAAPVGLKRVAEAVNFSVEIFSDSLKSDPKIKESASSFAAQTWLWPKISDAAAQAFLEGEMRSGMLGDSLGKLVSGGPAAGFEAFKKSSFAGYPAEVAEWKKDGNETDSPSLMRDNSSNMEIFYAQNSLLTVGFGQSTFSGGAHGMHGTTVKTFDLADKKALKISDVFTPGYEKTLAVALEKNARKQLGLRPDQPLTEALFENKIEPNENFGLTSKGIFFNYVPYEIAAYAAGEIQIFVPFENVRDALKKR